MALYHIINRGNYRKWIFDAASTRTAFKACLFQVCERSGWLLHAFVIMGNHYHLADEADLGFVARVLRSPQDARLRQSSRGWSLGSREFKAAFVTITSP
jgi:hypothetical protein